MRLGFMACAIATGCAANTVNKEPPCGPLSRDTALPDTMVYDTTQVTHKPELMSVPQLRYPEGPRDRGVQGRIILAFIIDPHGQAEPHSISVEQRLDPEMDREAASFVERAWFRPACRAGVPVRVRIQLPVDFKIVRPVR